MYKVDLRLKSGTQVKILLCVIGNHSFEYEQSTPNGTSRLLRHFLDIYLKIILISILATSRSSARKLQLLNCFDILDTDKSLRQTMVCNISVRLSKSFIYTNDSSMVANKMLMIVNTF